MAWITMLHREQLSVKLDDKDEAALLEVNDGGIAPSYVTVRLSEHEIDELIEALQRIKQAIL
ncbi:hypothetical protein LOZ80_24065 [Paenibacillus sp. HWE-109]|uniref:hypothetical protein n=1 Tax=Paenibacillus sp. HWE-109 TaxID=1306526 RepID=UPI001EDE3E59|nr:hypothetical protein [Paenibacillus sp. HWE-109]UKS24677.1 hypothetical protein LOZ80_24065 [Paenibacillus sp. HWE-109]